MEPLREAEPAAAPRLDACPPSLPAPEPDAPFSLLRLLSQLLQRLLPSPISPLFWLPSEAHAGAPETAVPGWETRGLPPILAVQHHLRVVSSSYVLGGADQNPGPLRAKFPEILQRAPWQPRKAVLEPDPDCGYYSLEVEEQLREAWAPKERGGEALEERDLAKTPRPLDDRDGAEPEAAAEVCPGVETDLPAVARPACPNKLIDYILGGACSGEESEGEDNEEEEEDWYGEEEDDDGFDSEGPTSESEISQNEESDDLWNSFCSPDPYDPWNFTAAVQTAVTVGEEGPPRESNESEAVEEESSSWTESSCEEDEWESGSLDESENLKLWNSFINLDDPYNPFHFKAQFQSAGKKGKSDLKGSKGLGHSPSQPSILFSCQLHLFDNGGTENPKYGILSRDKCKKKKKVTFLEEVTEYYVSNEEDRKGPWEELARDGCRFHKRIQETEYAIGYCLAIEHRQRIRNRFQEMYYEGPDIF